MLDERKCKILQAIVDDYISTAEPIGSRTIARKYKLGISPATIRNEMADLELLGYIEQPHTSSGRIPSAKGYRFYVDCLMSPQEMTVNDINLINSWYIAKVKRIDEVFKETARIISRMTRNISMVMAPQLNECAFKYLQFLPFDDRRVVLVIVTDNGLIENKIIDTPSDISFKELQQIAAGINSRLSGLTFNEISSAVLGELKQDIIPDKRLFDSALEIIQQALAGKRGNKVYLGGTTQLLSQPEFQDVEKVKGLLTMLEQERLLCDIMKMKGQEGVVVTIGQENKYSGIQDCSMVQATYRIDGQIVGTVAVLGPTRMEYGKIMTVLEFMHGHLGEVLKKYKL